MPGLALWLAFWDKQAWLDPCSRNPIPLPNGMTVFQPANPNEKLVHLTDGNTIITRSDYALWCCQCGSFVPKSEVGVDVPGRSESFRGVF
jgi:hypothetical protein